MKRLFSYILKNKITLLQYISIVLFFSIFAYVTSVNYVKDYQLAGKQDIYYEFTAANLLMAGFNPYLPILDGNLLVNKKYATLFPLYYYLLGLISYFNGYIFKPFTISFWYLIMTLQFFSAVIIYKFFSRENKGWVGVLAAGIYLMNRWTINSTTILKQDSISIFFLLLSLYNLSKYPKLSFLSYGVSLGIKHLSILALPIYLLYVFDKRKEIKKGLILLSLILVPILVPSIKLLIEEPKAFIYSIIFSTTRAPISVGTENFTGFEKILTDYSNLGNTIAMFYLLLPRLPLFVMILIGTVLLFSRKVNNWTYLGIVFLIFTGLNPVYFVQYSLWITPFALFPLLKEE